MAASSEKKYSTTRYWRFVFTPMLLVTLLVGLVLLFTSPDTQVTDFGSVIQKTNSVLATTKNLRV